MSSITRPLVLAALLALPLIALAADAPDPKRFEGSIQKFEDADKKQKPEAGGVLFTGSSSIRMWDLDESFPELGGINRGFGGSTMPDLLHYFDRVVTPYKPRAIVVYEGDNDIKGGRSADQVFEDFQTFVGRVRSDVGEDVEIVYVAIKPSRARWGMWPTMHKANAMIAAYASAHDHVQYADIATPMFAESPVGEAPPADLFIQDGLHLSKKGYALWAGVVGPLIGAKVAGVE